MRNLTEDFPILKVLNYLNAASIGPVPQPVIDFSTNFDAEIARGGTKTLSEEIKSELRKTERPIELSIRQGLTRASPHFYNTERDIQEFIGALKRVTG